MEYTVEGHTIRYLVQGESETGEDYCLLADQTDLTAGTAWSGKGYTIEPLFEKDLYAMFRQESIALLHRCWESAGLALPENFAPEKYHTIVPDQQTHLRAIEQTKLLTTDRFPVDISLVEDHISALCGRRLVAKNPFDDQQIFHFRVIRPRHGDNNPLHRDVWLEDYSDCINLYIPIAGSNALSSLILVPGSHRWKESRLQKTVGGAVINGQQFNVPAVSDIYGTYELVRPNPKPAEVLIFSPYLVHGGAANLNKDITRVSIELRLWKK